MKRVKVMLSAILIMAVVAGALAFKAKNPNQFCYYTATTTLASACDLTTTTVDIAGLVENASGTLATIIPTVNQPDPCPTKETRCLVKYTIQAEE